MHSPVSFLYRAGNIQDLTSRKQHVSMHWSDDINAWVEFNLGQSWSLVLTQYTIQHGGGGIIHSLRNWVLEGNVLQRSLLPRTH